ncbi:CAP-associated domain-containing protein [Lysinibacillus sp. KU-BSD001]|uniref:CAP domain-containing protein n=1 Tax=Lysinibacillus sp. KU-BSD001 TaxID=3141328 RepID=UPI0036E73EA9
MKALFRILIISSFLGIIFYYSNIEEQNVPLEGPNAVQQAIPSEQYINDYNEALSRPETGISTMIGQPSEIVLENYGEPNRIDRSAFGYEWWVYNRDATIMFGIEQGQITQVYTNAENIDVSPYYIGQSVEDVYRMTIVDAEVSVAIDENVFIFTMSEDDTKNRLLAKFDTIYAQLYIDEERGILAGIRYMNGKTLVQHQPYEMQFTGELVEKQTPSSFLQFELNRTMAKQLFELTNVYRQKYDLEPLLTFNELNTTAMAHSEDMFLQNYMSHESPTYGSLQQRLKDSNIVYEKANENVAMAYYDAIEAVHGLLNSPNHRETMLNDEYTHVGTGVYYNYYTQIFLKQVVQEESETE